MIIYMATDATTPDPASYFYQYGVVGVMLLVMIGVVRYLNSKNEQRTKDLINELTRSRDEAESRAAAAALLSLDSQKFIQKKVLPALSDVNAMLAWMLRNEGGSPPPRRRIADDDDD